MPPPEPGWEESGGGRAGRVQRLLDLHDALEVAHAKRARMGRTAGLVGAGTAILGVGIVAATAAGFGGLTLFLLLVVVVLLGYGVHALDTSWITKEELRMLEQEIRELEEPRGGGS